MERVMRGQPDWGEEGRGFHGGWERVTRAEEGEVA